MESKDLPALFPKPIAASSLLCEFQPNLSMGNGHP